MDGKERGKARGKNKRERVKMPEAVQSRINETKRDQPRKDSPKTEETRHQESLVSTFPPPPPRPHRKQRRLRRFRGLDFTEALFVLTYRRRRLRLPLLPFLFNPLSPFSTRIPSTQALGAPVYEDSVVQEVLRPWHAGSCCCFCSWFVCMVSFCSFPTFFLWHDAAQKIFFIRGERDLCK